MARSDEAAGAVDQGAGQAVRPLPAYKGLAADLRAQILAGDFPPTLRLPTDAELSATYAVSRQTVRQAFNELVSEGLVYRVRGRGSFALAVPGGRTQYLRSLGSIEDLLALSEDTELEVIEPLAETIDVAAAGRLALTSDAVYRCVVRRLHNGLPIGRTTVYLPPSLGKLARNPSAGRAGMISASTIIALVDEANDSPITGAFQSVTVTTVDEQTAPLIDCPVGTPALTTDRLYYDAKGIPVELAISVFNPQRYSYRLRLHRTVH